MQFNFEYLKTGRIHQFKLSGSLLDKYPSIPLTDKIEELLLDNESQILLDLSAMNHMNSTGLGILISILTKTRNSGGEVLIVNVPPKINQLLLITKLHSVFNVVNSMEEATEFFTNTTTSK